MNARKQSASRCSGLWASLVTAHVDSSRNSRLELL